MTYLYNVVDGIFVGRGTGSAGLGAVNLGVPFITTAVALASMFPMGGAVLVSTCMGKKNQKEGGQVFMNSLLSTLILSIILMIIGMVFPQQIIQSCGSGKISTDMNVLAVRYLFYYCAFSIPMLMSTCLSVFVRNDGAPVLAFIGMCTGPVCNIFLDWLFIFPMQKGGDWCCCCFRIGTDLFPSRFTQSLILGKGELRVRKFQVDFRLIGRIAANSVAEAVTQLSTPVTSFCFNIVLARYSGDIGIAVFSVLSFIYSLANSVLCGTAQGLQPLWGISYGENDRTSVQKYKKMGLCFNLLLSILIYFILFVFASPIIRIFNNEPALVDSAASALPIFALSFIPMAVNLIYTCYYYSVGKTRAASLIAVSRGIVLKALCILLLPSLAGIDKVWLAPAVSESITFLLIEIKKLHFNNSETFS